MDKDRVLKAALKRQQEVANLCDRLEGVALCMRGDMLPGARLVLDAVYQLRNLTGLDQQVSPTGGSDAVPSLAESVPPRNPQLPD
jgi:hypothetical protein